MYRLRELRREDLPVINAWRNRPELIAFLGAPFRFINLEVDVAWFENYMRNRQNAIRCTVLRTEDERILGLVSLTDIDFLNQSAEFHIMIGDVENQDHGAGTFAVRAMVEHAFFHMNLHRVALGVLEDNLRAQHVYEKVGFSREGVARASTFKDGRFVNIYRYAILREDYPPPCEINVFDECTYYMEEIPAEKSRASLAQRLRNVFPHDVPELRAAVFQWKTCVGKLCEIKGECA